jgi:methyl-accepting chemotaxis protein
VTRKELRKALESLLAGQEKIDDLEELVGSFEKTLGEVEGTVTAVESNLAVVEGAVGAVEETALYNTEAIARLLEVVTNPEAEAEAEAEGLQELAKSVGDLDSMTQAEKTDFIIGVIKYILAKEKIS